MVYSYIVIWLYNNKANAASVDIIYTFELCARFVVIFCSVMPRLDKI